MQSYDFVVVGGGIAGASFAARVAPHARVLVLEQEVAPGYHATGRSAALFSALIGDATVQRLTRASRHFFDRPPAGFSPHPLLTPRQALHIGTGAQAELAAQRLALPETRVMDAATALSQVPILCPHAVAHAVLEPAACDIDVHGLHQGFIDSAKAQGAVFLNRAVVDGLESAAGGWLIEAAGQTWKAHTLVNAAGAWADEVARMAGLRARGLQPLRRTALLADLPAGVTAHAWPAVIALDESFYFKPDAGWLLISPADETPSPPCDAQAEEWDVAVAIDRVENATTLSIQRVARSWAGLRTFAPDRLPLVGYDPEHPQFFWLAGQGGYGVQTSPALSAFAADLALGRPLAEELQAAGLDSPAVFSPGRRFAPIGSPVPSVVETTSAMDLKL